MATSVLDETPETFTFHEVPEATFAAHSDAALKDLLAKWGLAQHLQLKTYRYDQFYQPHMFGKLVMDFLNSKEVQATFSVPVKVAKTADAGAPAMQPFGVVTSCKMSEVTCKRTNFDIFDRLSSSGIVKESGRIQHTFETTVDDLLITDKLREMILVEDCENYSIYDEEERNDFLFRLFAHLVLGGGMCQHEDEITPYFEATKKLYKDLLAVRKNSDNGAVEVVSQVVELRRIGFKSDGAPLFPSRSRHSFCYIVINPIKRTTTIVHCPWISLWGN